MCIYVCLCIYVYICACVSLNVCLYMRVRVQEAPGTGLADSYDTPEVGLGMELWSSALAH